MPKEGEVYPAAAAAGSRHDNDHYRCPTSSGTSGARDPSKQRS